MYVVKLTIKPSDPNNSKMRYKKQCYEGMYFPKKGKKVVKREKIAEQVNSDFVGKIRKQHPHLLIDCRIVSIVRVKTDFHVVEDDENDNNNHNDSTM